MPLNLTISIFLLYSLFISVHMKFYLNLIQGIKLCNKHRMTISNDKQHIAKASIIFHKNQTFCHNVDVQCSTMQYRCSCIVLVFRFFFLLIFVTFSHHKTTRYALYRPPLQFVIPFGSVLFSPLYICGISCAIVFEFIMTKY